MELLLHVCVHMFLSLSYSHTHTHALTHTHIHGEDLWTTEHVMCSNGEAETEWRNMVFCTGVKLMAKNIEVLNWVIQFDLVYESTVRWIAFLWASQRQNSLPTFRVSAHQFKNIHVAWRHSLHFYFVSINFFLCSRIYSLYLQGRIEN